MKHKLSKKTKIFLSVASAIITNTAVTTLLTSCSLSNKIDDLGGFDKEYGINNATYTRMEQDFEVLYRSQLDQRKDSGEINDDIYDSNLYAFQKKLNSLHASLYSGENKTLSYTIKTNVLRDYARDNYGIRLSRQSSVILNEAISDIKSSIRGSVLLMCKEYGITDTSEYYKKVDTEFDKLEKEAKAKYGDADVVSIIQYIQNGMATCFEGICEQLDCLATQQQLKQFIENYSINVKKDVADDYCWDKLFSKYGDGNKEISAEDFNNIFEISCEELDPQSSNTPYLLTSKKIVEFKNNIIPGYTLKPILIKMNSDSYTNTYSIDVDYTLVNDNYINNEDVAQLTAHSSPLKNQSFYEDENTSIFDLNASDEEREYTNYVLPITKQYEEEQINATYFNNEDFKFSWSTSEEYGYDDFWTENEEGACRSTYNESILSNTGMEINGYLLSELLKDDNGENKPIEYQNAIKLIKNTHFSLDFTENSYDTEIDGKKGEIKVNNFIIGYKNSENKFNLLEENKNIIEKAINDDSNITRRFSKNLWYGIKTNYDKLVSLLDVTKLKNDIDFRLTTIDEIELKYTIIHAAMSVITATLLVVLLTLRKTSLKTNIILGIGVGLIIVATVISIIFILTNMSSSDNNLKNHLMKITPEDQSSYRIVKNINNDSKYFANETGQNEFNNLPIDEMRNKKSYYDSDYKLIKKDAFKDQTESDIQEYFGGKNGCEELLKDIDELAEAYKFTYAITALSALMIILMIIFIVKVCSKKDNHQNDYQYQSIIHSNYQQITMDAADLKEMNRRILLGQNMQEAMNQSYNSIV